MKNNKNIKILLGIYIGTLLFACFLANRMKNLEIAQDLRNKNESIILKVS